MSAQLRAKYDAKDFIENDIYPWIWDKPIEECLDAFVLIYFEELKSFILRARTEKKGMIIYLN